MPTKICIKYDTQMPKVRKYKEKLYANKKLY